MQYQFTYICNPLCMKIENTKIIQKAYTHIYEFDNLLNREKNMHKTHKANRKGFNTM